MKRFETANKSREEFTAALSELRVKLSEFQFERADKKLKDFSQFRKTKKDIARILTALNTQ
jgi:ribosomal protein L29